MSLTQDQKAEKAHKCALHVFDLLSNFQTRYRLYARGYFLENPAFQDTDQFAAILSNVQHRDVVKWIFETGESQNTHAWFEPWREAERLAFEARRLARTNPDATVDIIRRANEKCLQIYQHVNLLSDYVRLLGTFTSQQPVSKRTHHWNYEHDRTLHMRRVHRWILTLPETTKALSAGLTLEKIGRNFLSGGDGLSIFMDFGGADPLEWETGPIAPRIAAPQATYNFLYGDNEGVAFDSNYADPADEDSARALSFLWNFDWERYDALHPQPPDPYHPTYWDFVNFSPENAADTAAQDNWFIM